MKTDVSNFKNNQALFLADKKEIHFKFMDEVFAVDLTEGDLEDSWNTIFPKDGNAYDTNFDCEDENSQPSFCIYPIADNQIDSKASIKMTIICQSGTLKQYFS